MLIIHFIMDYLTVDETMESGVNIKCTCWLEGLRSYMCTLCGDIKAEWNKLKHWELSIIISAEPTIKMTRCNKYIYVSNIKVLRALTLRFRTRFNCCSIFTNFVFFSLELRTTTWNYHITFSFSWRCDVVSYVLAVEPREVGMNIFVRILLNLHETTN